MSAVAPAGSTTSVTRRHIGKLTRHLAGRRFSDGCWHGYPTRLMAGILLVLALVLMGCQIAQSPFARMATNTGAALAAASTTITYVHEGKIPRAYAESSFVNYRSELNGLDSQITTTTSGISAEDASHLLAIYRQALAIVNHPCLQASCDWRAQRDLLDRASRAFLRAGRT